MNDERTENRGRWADHAEETVGAAGAAQTGAAGERREPTEPETMGPGHHGVEAPQEDSSSPPFEAYPGGRWSTRGGSSSGQATTLREASVLREVGWSGGWRTMRLGGGRYLAGDVA